MATRIRADQLDYERARRGLTARALSRLAGCHEATLSRARLGHPINEATLHKITAALLQVPVLAGSDLLLTNPNEGRPAA